MIELSRIFVLFSLIHYEKLFGWVFLVLNLCIFVGIISNYLKNASHYIRGYPVIFIT
jgi:hypothetical protein